MEHSDCSNLNFHVGLHLVMSTLETCMHSMLAKLAGHADSIASHAAVLSCRECPASVQCACIFTTAASVETLLCALWLRPNKRSHYSIHEVQYLCCGLVSSTWILHVAAGVTQSQWRLSDIAYWHLKTQRTTSSWARYSLTLCLINC